MECTVKTTDIDRVMGMVAPVAKHRPGAPALSQVMLEIKDRTLIVRGYDLETEIMVSLSCDGETNGSLTVDGRSFRKYISALPKVDTIRIIGTDVNEGKELASSLVITAGNVSHTLPALPSSEYPPELPKPYAEEIRLLPIQPFAAAMRQVLPAVAVAGSRLELNAVCMSSDGNVLRLAGADGFVLAVRQLPFSFLKKLNGLLPLKSANHLVKLCTAYKDSDNLNFTHQVLQRGALSEDHMYSFKFDDATTTAEMTGQFVGGDFPNYDQHTAKAEPVATFQADAVLKALGQLNPGGPQSATIRLYLEAFHGGSIVGQAVQLTPHHLPNGVIKLTHGDPGGVTSQVVIPAAISQDRRTAINEAYLAMALKASEGQTTIAVAGELDPVQFVDSAGLTYAVMPIVVKW